MNYKKVGRVLDKIANYKKKNEKDIMKDLTNLGKQNNLSKMEQMIIGCLCLIFIKKFVELRENSVLSSFSNFLTAFNNAKVGKNTVVHYDTKIGAAIEDILGKIKITKKSNFSEEMRKVCVKLIPWARLTADEMDVENWDKKKKGDKFEKSWDDQTYNVLSGKFLKLLEDNKLTKTKQALIKATNKVRNAKC